MRTGRGESAPACPFCWGTLGRPEQVLVNELESVPGGKCLSCGARFLIDPTGKNVGEVMMHGLRMAAEELGKDLGSLVSGEDYEDSILSYDVKLHKSLGPSAGYMDRYGRLYIIKLLEKQ